MDIQFWIWVAVIVLSLIARANKSKKQPTHTPERAPEDRGAEKPMTFEELLREIQATKEPPRPQPVAPAAPIGPIDYDDDLKDEEQDLETVPSYRKDDEIYAVYEKAKSEAFSRASLEGTVKLEDTDMRYGQFAGYKNPDRQGVGRSYAAAFQDREAFKKAFIMGEILNRRF